MNEADFYLEIINHLTDGVYFVDISRTIRFWNHAAEKITGYTAEEIVGVQCHNSKLNHVDKEGRQLCILGCPLFRTIEDGQTRKAQVLIQHKEGYRVPVSVTIFPIFKKEKIIGAVEIFSRSTPTVFEDSFITNLSNMAMHDSLTQLPNRRYMENFLQYKIHEASRFQQNVVLIFADIDNFGLLNNTYGHDVGDSVLRNIASSILHNIRKNDLVARWGGEEFLGVYTIKEPEQAAFVAEKFRILVQNTVINENGQEIYATVSVGATLMKENDTIDSVVKRADELMYQSKKSGKNCVTIG